MRLSTSAIIAACLVLAIQGSLAQQDGYGQSRNFGLGIIIGEPSGLSAKLWTSNVNAFDFGLGWSIAGDGRYNGAYTGRSRVHMHMDYLWHAFDVIQSTERFPVYYGIGGRFNSGGGYRSSVAVRGVIGVAWMPRDTPIDVFVELAPSLQLSPSTAFGIDAGIGARYYF
jgi:hypothetical protein